MPNLTYNLNADSVEVNSLIENPSQSTNVVTSINGTLSVKQSIVEVPSYTKKIIMDISGNVYTRNFIEQSSVLTYTLKDNPSTSANDSNPVGDTTADTWCSSGWIAGSSYRLTRLDLNLEKNGSPTGVITVKIYNSTNGTVATGTPSTLLGTSNTINASSLTTGFVQTSFLFSTPVSITSGTGYFVAINYSIINASNYVIWGDDSTIHTSCYYESADAITWNQICLGCLTPNLWTYSSP